MAFKKASLVVGALFVIGCGELPDDAVEQQQSALITGKQYVMVPAYFDPQSNAADFDTLTDWDNHNSQHAISVAVVNLGCEQQAAWNPQDQMGACQPDPNGRRVAGGPGSANDPAIGARWSALATKIQRFRASGIEVYGYVDFYPNRPSFRIDQDVAAWKAFGNNLGQPLDGVFYDDADRGTSVGLPRAVYYTNHARLNIHRANAQGRVIFNYGVTRPSTGDFVSASRTWQGFPTCSSRRKIPLTDTGRSTCGVSSIATSAPAIRLG